MRKDATFVGYDKYLLKMINQKGLARVMDKIPTLFLRNPENMRLVTHEVNPEATWVFDGNAVPTRKRDGTNIRVHILNGTCTLVEKRRNPTREEKATGAEPGYVDANRNDSSDKHIFAAVDATNF